MVTHQVGIYLFIFVHNWCMIDYELKLKLDVCLPNVTLAIET